MEGYEPGRMQVYWAVPSCNLTRYNDTVAKWKAKGYKSAVLVNGLPRELAYEFKADYIVWQKKYPGWPTSTNILCQHLIPYAHIVVGGGDDMDPDPRHNAQELADEFTGRFPNGFGIMQPTGDNIGGETTICGSPWMGDRWIREAYGGRGPMWSEYGHFYADQELKEVAQKLGVLWQRQDLVQKHHHWSRPGGPEKTDYQKALDKFWDRDKALYFMRQKSDWPNMERLERIKVVL